MLKHLRITNFAILSDVQLDLAAGYNVLTGETGAGKSLIVDAVALLRGGRASADIPRTGADEAVVEAVFAPPADLAPLVASRLEAAGLASGEDGDVLIRRVIIREGKGSRSRIHVNGGLTTAAVLAEIGSLLVELSGQHEHQGLVDARRHVQILDSFGVPAALVDKMAAAHARLVAAAEAATGGALDERQRADREGFLRFQLEELDGAKLVAGEEHTLAAERDVLRSAGRLGGAARRAEEELYAREGAVVDVIQGLRRELEPLGLVDPKLGALAAPLSEAQALIEDAAQGFRRYADGVRDDPDRLAEVDDRLHVVQRLVKKHGGDSAAVIARRDELAAELAELEAHDDRRAALEAEVRAAQASAAAAARALTKARVEAGTTLARDVSAALAELGMVGAALTVVVDPRRGDGVDALVVDGRRIGVHGWDTVELRLQSNQGEDAKPLAKIASGGELSRIMLALKLCLRHAGGCGTYVFDEVDAGVGGPTAEVIGRQIRRVADERQVICVTHLAPIAALGDVHFHVSKSIKDGRTETEVVTLEADARRDELARMLGGLTITPRTRAAADEMLTASRFTKNGKKKAEKVEKQAR